MENLELRPDTRAWTAANRNVVDGKADTDAGHLLAREFGGARDESNLVQMVRDLNRGWGGRSLVDGRSVRHMEIAVGHLIERNPGKSVGFDLRVAYDGS